MTDPACLGTEGVLRIAAVGLADSERKPLEGLVRVSRRGTRAACGH